MHLDKARFAGVSDSVIDEIEARIVSLGGVTLGNGLDQCMEIPVTHRFAPGLYAREMVMPKFSIAVSKIHRTEHFYVVSSGKLAVFDGESWTVIVAPFTGTTKPGTRRVGIALEDTVWTTFHPTELTDVLAIEEEIIEPHRNALMEVAA